MPDARLCARCGTEIPADAAEDVCPPCLAQLALEGEETSPVGAADPGTPASSRFTAPDPAELSPRLPQLDVLELLGRGGMGAVYKARQSTLDRMVAVKILPPEVADPGFSERFTREARALARLNHPNIVAVYDFGETDGLYYFVMEFVDGVSLRQMMQSGKLDSREALSIVPKICDALQYAHDEGIVHRDIKPDNILVDRKGRVKIADFGLAKLVTRTDHTLTGSGHVLGTPHYMAPEQMAGAPGVDHRADIYSLGVVFYEMLTGELPVGRWDPPSKRVEVDVRLDRVVLKALEAEPARRYQRAGDMKTDVESVASATGEPVTTASAEPEPRPAPSVPAPSRARRLRALWVVSTVLTFLTLGLLWVVLHPWMAGHETVQYLLDLGQAWNLGVDHREIESKLMLFLGLLSCGTAASWLGLLMVFRRRSPFWALSIAGVAITVLCVLVLVDVIPTRKELNRSMARAIEEGDAGATAGLLARGVDPRDPLTYKPDRNRLPFPFSVYPDPEHDRSDGQPTVHVPSLFHAALWNDREIVDLLLREGVQAHQKDRTGISALHVAAGRGSQGIVRLLIEKGADVNAQSHVDWTPLMVAAVEGHADVTEILLEAGADPNLRAAHMPDRIPGTDSADSQGDRYPRPIARGMYSRIMGGQGPLMLAVYCGHREVVDVLLKHRADATVPDEVGTTPLMFAAMYGHGEIVKALLEHGADPDRTNNVGKTARSHAEELGHEHIVNLLDAVPSDR